MKIRVPYGTDIAEKTIEKGFFACPVCSRKREYSKNKVYKFSYFGFFQIPSRDALLIYLRCHGCLNALSADVIGPENQLKISLSNVFSSNNELFEEWQLLYKDLKCEDFLADNPDVASLNNPFIKTSAYNMQQAGVAIKMENYKAARSHLFYVILAEQKIIENRRVISGFSRAVDNEKTKALDKLQSEFTVAAHFLLSKLP